MSKKEIIISVVIVVVLLALGVVLTQNTEMFKPVEYNYRDNFDEFGDIGGDMGNVNPTQECYSDSDCVKVETSCCLCSSGGEEICMNKAEAKKYTDKLAKCNPNDVICAQVYNCKINSCSCLDRKCAGK